MPVSINTCDVRQALRPALGSDMVEATDVADQAAHILRSFAPYRDTFGDLAERIANVLFNALYSAVGPSMTVRRDDGSRVRIMISDLPGIADDCLYALFRSLTVYSVNYENLKEYAMHTGSLSAMRVLIELYDAFQSPAEKELMQRILRES